MTKLLRAGAPPNPKSTVPFRAAMMQMHEAMSAASGKDVADTYLRKMLEHHRGAIAMSRIVLTQTKDAKIRSMAESIRTDQAKEVTMVEGMLRGGVN